MKFALRTQSGTSLLEISLVLWIIPMLLLGMIELSRLFVNPPAVKTMEEELFFHTVERLMWRSSDCRVVASELQGTDMDPSQAPTGWRLLRVGTQIRLKKEFGGELVYAQNVSRFVISAKEGWVRIELNEFPSRSFTCDKVGSF